tara:strand:+ start:286 stop:654 length:369 start_codon:yes stop_codon:yes gene_type:complete
LLKKSKNYGKYNTTKERQMSDMKDLLRQLFAIDNSKKEVETSCNACGNAHAIDEECPVDEGYDNEPDVQIKEYDPNEYSGGINKPKKAYKAAQRGDNAMAVEESINELESRIRAELTALYKL